MVFLIGNPLCAFFDSLPTLMGDRAMSREFALSRPVEYSSSFVVQEISGAKDSLQ